LTVESFDTFGNRYFDIGAGGPDPFEFSISANVSWLSFSDSSGSISSDEPETRIYVSVSDWSQVVSTGYAAITVKGTVDGEKPASASIMFAARNTQSELSSGFQGIFILVFTLTCLLIACQRICGI